MDPAPSLNGFSFSLKKTSHPIPNSSIFLPTMSLRLCRWSVSACHSMPHSPRYGLVHLGSRPSLPVIAVVRAPVQSCGAGFEGAAGSGRGPGLGLPLPPPGPPRIAALSFQSLDPRAAAKAARPQLCSFRGPPRCPSSALASASPPFAAYFCSISGRCLPLIPPRAGSHWLQCT